MRNFFLASRQLSSLLAAQMPYFQGPVKNKASFPFGQSLAFVLFHVHVGSSKG